MNLPRVWFERAILPDLVADVEHEVEVLGPAIATDRYAGIAAAEGIVAGSFRYDAELMDHAPGARVIARTGIGVDTVDVPEATRRGIAVCNAPDGPTASTAEHAVMLMLAVAKNLERSEEQLRSGGAGHYADHTGIELAGTTLGLVGFGRIARRVATAARGLEMKIVVFDPFLDDGALPGDVTRARDLQGLLGVADVVSVHVPLSDGTRGMFDAAAFAAMRPGAVFVNTARGGLVDHAALLDALGRGHLFGAGLDVTDPEPLPPDHPLLHRPDVIVTPHVASGTFAGKRRIFRTALEQVLHVLRGERPPHLINPEVWPQPITKSHAERGS